MTEHIKLYALGFFVLMTGLLVAINSSDLFRTMFSVDRASDRDRACTCKLDDALASVSKASFAMSADNDQTELIELETIEKLASDFNEAKGKVRLVTLLSPTCSYCIAGMRAMRNILQRNDDPHLQVFVVWEPMRYSDNKEEAQKISREFAVDDRVIHYWDENKITGKQWKSVLEIDPLAWDIYMLYDAEVQWNSAPTAPDYWMHQLGGVGETKAPYLDEAIFEKHLRQLLDRNID